MGGEGDHRIDPCVPGDRSDVLKQFCDVGKREEQTLPESVLLLRESAATDLPLDLLASLEGRLLVGLGVDEALIGVASGEHPGSLRPVPGGAEGADLLACRHRRNGRLDPAPRYASAGQSAGVPLRGNVSPRVATKCRKCVPLVFERVGFLGVSCVARYRSRSCRE